jgi:NAD(P)-dependent dehydrogenase (short-subunit alcohol dehydrogenase family)
MRRESGCILNTASIAGMGLGGPSGFAHAATKGGVIAMTACLAVELSPLNVRVNAIAPGVIDTPGLKPLTSSPAGEAQKASALVPRFGTSEDIAAAAAYLCSDEASYVTGITLPVEGGFLASGGAGRPPVRMALPIEFN